MAQDFIGLSIFSVETYQPLDSLPRITAFHHATARENLYSSWGDRRSNEKHCIFHYTLRGRGQFWMGGTCYDIHEGQGFLNVINDANCGYRYPANGTEKWEFAVFCLDGGNTREIVSELINTYGPVFTVPRQNSTMQKLLDKQHLKPDSILSTGESYRLCTALLSMLIDCATHPDVHAASSRLIYAIQQEAKSHPGIRVTDLANKLDYSREHLTRQFRIITGKPLKQYLDEQKLLYICDLLLNTSLSINDIALKTQFSTATNLHRFFKEKTDMTPTEFRQRGVLRLHNIAF